MYFSLTALVRLCALLGLVASASAIGLSRTVPKAAAYHVGGVPRYVGVNGIDLSPPRADSFLLDCATGGLTPFNPIRGHRVEFAAASPWNEEGGGELVARVTARDPVEGEAGDSSSLVHVPLSGGPIRREVPGAPLVEGRACWLPGSHSRVVFPGGDGVLYVQDLTADDPAGADRPGSPPRPITWKTRRPGGGTISLADPVCPPIPALGGRLFVALSHGRERETSQLAAAQIWWLKLGPDGFSIVDAGPLTPESRALGDERPEERFPSLGVAPDGRIVMTFLTREIASRSWRLNIAPIESFGADRPPIVRPSEIRSLTDGSSATPPAFSTDGQSLYLVTRNALPDGGHVRQVSLVEALSIAPTQQARFASQTTR